MKKILLLFTALVLAVCLSACTAVPAPQVTRGEFPFEIVYEKNGERVTVRDVYVCEFEGIEWNENFGRYRRWKGYLRSTGENTLVLLEDNGATITCNVGSAAYYMNDPNGPDIDEITPTVQRVQKTSSGGVSAATLSAETLSEQYGIRLLSWSFSEPIENRFE